MSDARKMTRFDRQLVDEGYFYNVVYRPIVSEQPTETDADREARELEAWQDARDDEFDDQWNAR